MTAPGNGTALAAPGPWNRRPEPACPEPNCAGEMISDTQEEPGGSRTEVDTPLIQLCNLTKTFGGVTALDNVSLEVRSGRVLALLGENGAGKSTLIKIMAGVYRADEGSATFRDAPLSEAVAAGKVAFIHQDHGLIDWMTAAENIAFGSGYRRGPGGLINWRGTRRRAEQVLELVGGRIPVATAVSELSRTERSLICIARAMASDADVIVLDEPTASLPANDVDRLFEVMETLKNQGVALIFVSHRIDEVFRVCDGIAVMRDGRLVTQTTTTDTTPARVVRDIVGPRREAVIARHRSTTGTPLLTVSALCADDAGPVDLSLRSGELLALVGLRGAGQESVGRALVGSVPVTRGAVRLKGRDVTARQPSDAVHAGIGFVTGDRLNDGVGIELSIRENLFLNPAAYGRRILDLRSPRAERRDASRLVAQFNVKCPDPETRIGALSGGNQQKVILARCLSWEPSVIVLEEPTIGVDVGAKAEIYRLLDKVLGAGHAALLVSTDFDEVATVADRALVFNGGKVVSELAADEITAARLVSDASALTIARPPTTRPDESEAVHENHS